MAVDEGAVGAPLVHHGPGRAPALDAGVAARDGAVVQGDVAARVAADQNLVLRDLERVSGGGHEAQSRHFVFPP
jgi:hypothetical protein